ncbi:hypothetical protein XU18_4316 [Perkinsela sp. CCAP 1560/4]|nr:hypothetical protein XU18_4316 [Perkinsela sp. CCAP 1560/4]|eukprot:KNH04457.1 hypothetical protein XU18_4316 [Perkinsela sp. CCAP 1560/4]
MQTDFGTSNKRVRLARVSDVPCLGDYSIDDAAARGSQKACTPGEKERQYTPYLEPARSESRVLIAEFETPQKAMESCTDREAITTVRTKLASTPEDAVTPGGSRVSAARTPSSAFTQSFKDFSPREEKQGKEWMEAFKEHMSYIDRQPLC